jgi:hypothetical protein
MNRVEVASNTTAANGGGIYNAGTLTLNESTVRNNIAGGQSSQGGGIQNGSGNIGTITINNSVIHDNIANGLFGGGMNNEYNANMTNVTVTNNLVAAAGGSGGGVRHLAKAAAGVTVNMTNVTLSNNQASTGGGLRRTTAGNAPVLKNVIVAENVGGNCAATEGSITSFGHNLSSDLTCPFGAAGDINNTNPGLGNLQNNGGPTLTRAIPSNSSAVNTGDNSGCPGTDQRGVARPSGGVCDIGAYEYDSGPPPTPTAPPTAPPTPSPVPTPSPTPAPTAVPGAFGNVDCGGGITSIDSLKVTRYTAGLSYAQYEPPPCDDIGTMTGWNELQGDVDCDSNVNSIDSLKLLRHAAGLTVSQTEPCPNIGS